MEISLTPAQWEQLKNLLGQGQRAEAMLGLPIELINGDIKIRIKADETKIILED
ncbi:MAG: hypothetical protein KAS32_17470 [Candidatus Peribacteraceae bacterium]|nr:hypothetical protein [Candidatus Peribacteraceae bacterium]